MDLIYLFVFAIVIIAMIVFTLAVVLFIINTIYNVLVLCMSNLRKKDTCTICLNEVKAVPLTCGHVFHKKCIDKWLKENSSCPNCREKVIYFV